MSSSERKKRLQSSKSSSGRARKKGKFSHSRPSEHYLPELKRFFCCDPRLPLSSQTTRGAGASLVVRISLLLFVRHADFTGLLHPLAFAKMRVLFPDVFLDFVCAVPSKQRDQGPHSLAQGGFRKVQEAVDLAVAACEFKPDHQPDKCGCSQLLLPRNECSMSLVQSLLLDIG